MRRRGADWDEAISWTRHDPIARRRAAGLVVVGVAVAALATTAPMPALAHASGELPRAELRARGQDVTIDLVAPADDAAAIGTSLGLLGEGAMVALLGGPADDLPTTVEVATLSSSPALRDYLEEHVVVSQDGATCPGQAFPRDDFLSDGARIEFRCPEPVQQAEVRITVLHALDPAYRTFSVDGTTQYAIHSSAAPEHTWDFTQAASPERGGFDPMLLGAAGLVGVAMLAALAVVGRRPRERRRA